MKSVPHFCNFLLEMGLSGFNSSSTRVRSNPQASVTSQEVDLIKMPSWAVALNSDVTSMNRMSSHFAIRGYVANARNSVLAKKDISKLHRHC